MQDKLVGLKGETDLLRVLFFFHFFFWLVFRWGVVTSSVQHFLPFAKNHLGSCQSSVKHKWALKLIGGGSTGWCET